MANARAAHLHAQPCASGGVRGREQCHCHLSPHPVIWHLFHCPATISKVCKEYTFLYTLRQGCANDITEKPVKAEGGFVKDFPLNYS